MSHLNNVKISEQRRVEKKKQTNKQATQREQASASIKFLYSNDGHSYLLGPVKSLILKQPIRYHIIFW